MPKQLKTYNIKLLIILILILAFLSLTLACFLWVFNSSSNKSRTPTWKPAKEIVNAPLLKKVLASASKNKLDEQAVKVMPITSSNGVHVFIFDFRSPQLCGAGGCLYQIYHESGKLLLQVMANPQLPPKEDLIRVSSRDLQVFPCLIFTQTTDIENIVSRTDYCFDSGQYTRFGETWTGVDSLGN
ncbi:MULTISPECIES: histidine kinase [Calothrix]|uniref:Histidine kinase n=2 Tax=Calothrix TaxID=1186 RepID=A0ABR8APC5_9CYAN|nr:MULTISPECIES: histidine kinase [Calothrix]MBD2200531.1 histidine kinase [Calothrix parietina FACHB-288]MBD2229577.1 histidine kinase [Calothrix anomala FACHB-343]